MKAFYNFLNLFFRLKVFQNILYVFFFCFFLSLQAKVFKNMMGRLFCVCITKKRPETYETGINNLKILNCMKQGNEQVNE